VNNGLPEALEEVEEQIKLYTLFETTCNAIRVSDNLSAASVATKELMRVRETLHKLRLREIKLKEKPKSKK
jgi:hypothetical protein